MRNNDNTVGSGRNSENKGLAQHDIRVTTTASVLGVLRGVGARLEGSPLRRAIIIPVTALALLSISASIAAGLPSPVQVAREAFAPTVEVEEPGARQVGEPTPASVELGGSNQQVAAVATDGIASAAPARPAAAPTTTVAAAPAAAESAPTTTPAAAPDRRPAPTPAPTTTAAPARRATPTTTAAPRPAAPTTTAAPAPAPVRRTSLARAGHNGNVGCAADCTQLGEHSLDGENGTTLANAVISNPNGRCLTIRNANNVTIRNVTITNCGTSQGVNGGYSTGLILIENSSNITFENVKIHNMSSARFIHLRNNALFIKNSTDVRIVNNEFRDIHSDISQKGGDQGNRSIGSTGALHGLTIEHNSFLNGGRNAVQIDRSQGLRGVSVSYNRVEGRGPWDSDYEDMFNFYSSSGTAGSPIRVRGNYMRNGGKSITGTAIILGDGNPAAGDGAHFVVEDNVILNPGHIGINIAGGNNITVRNNTILGTADVAHATTVGLSMNHYGYSSVCRDHVVTGNRVFMRNQLTGGVNHTWLPGTCQNVQMSGNVWGDSSLTPAIWNI